MNTKAVLGACARYFFGYGCSSHFTLAVAVVHTLTLAVINTFAMALVHALAVAVVHTLAVIYRPELLILYEASCRPYSYRAGSFLSFFKNISLGPKPKALGL